MAPSKTSARLLLPVCILLLLWQQSSRAAVATDALKFFNNFFVTGDYVVGGVGLWNTGSGTIHMESPAAPMSAAPDGAEALAAFLYWQVVTSADPTTVDVNAGATFNGLPLNIPLGTQLSPTSRGVEVGTQACPLNGGSGKRVHTFRSDVLRYLDVDPATGRRVINKLAGYSVSLANNGTTKTLGASLVVIYRHPDPAWPLKAIVMYDGSFVKQQAATLNQRIEGFYDPTSVPGQITYIAGSAQGNLGEILSGPFTTKSGAFVGGSGNAWDNISVTTNPLGGSTSLNTAIAPQTSGPLGFLVNDCVAMSAMIYRTDVNDVDQDGLLDRWEDADTTTLFDPNGIPLPDFRNMGANEGAKDIFIEIGAMRAHAGTTYGSHDAPLSASLESVTDSVGHNHMPTPAALKMLGDAFDQKGIRLHLDVGPPDAYHALFPTVENPNAADAYLIDAPYATGGELIDETACVPEPGKTGCQFPAYPGTVSWKTGFQLYKESRFDTNRKDSFRYALYAHAKAAPKSLFPCLAAAGGPEAFDANGNCANGATNPLFHVPGGVSGSGEYPGGDFLITLGLWDNTNFVGTDFGVAATTMHELGHTLDLGHGGEALPNCKPNYLSVMNYTFQLSGLMDADGVPHLGFSESSLNEINETSVTDGYQVPGPFRTSWYVPVSATDTRKAKRFCNGLKFDPTLPAPSMMRVDGGFDPVTKLPIDIDWNANGVVDPPYLQDVNFDGQPDATTPSTALQGYDDWNHLLLNQVGGRRNFGGISIGPLGVRLLSDGKRLLADGSVLLSDDGKRLLADGSMLLGDGSIFRADGSRLLADGAKFLADGSVLLADGKSVALPDGVRLLSDGSRLLADGSRLLADGTSPVNNDGKRLLADGARLLADGTSTSGSVLLADGSVFLADGAVLLPDGSVQLGDGVRLLSDGLSVNAGSRLLADGATLAWEFTESTPQVAAESGIIPGPNSLTACVIGGSGVSACPSGPSEPLHRVRLNWMAPNTGNVAVYRVYRVVGDTVPPGGGGVPVEVPGTQTSYVDPDELPNGVTFTYVVDALLADEHSTQTPRSNNKTITAENTKPVAVAQAVVVWEDFLGDVISVTSVHSNVITLTGYDPDSSGLGFTADSVSARGGVVSGPAPSMSYVSAANYNGPDSFTFKVRETSTWNGQNQESDPGTVSLTVMPVNDIPSFTKGPDQTVTQPVGTQTVVGWASGFDAGPTDEDLNQPVLNYIVSIPADQAGLFETGGQPAIATNGALTYSPKAGASGTATVTVRVRDSGGTDPAHGGVDTSDPKTFTITIKVPIVVATLTSAGPADVWFSNPNTTNNSKSNKYDLKAEVLKNGVVVTSGELKNVTLDYNGTTLSKAVLKVIALLPTTLSPSVPFVTGDAMKLRVSARYVSGTPTTGSLRLWFNTPLAADDTSHLHAKVGGPDIRYHLIGLAPTHAETAFALKKGVVPTGPTQYVERLSLPKVGSSGAYTEFGTWSITGP